MGEPRYHSGRPSRANKKADSNTLSMSTSFNNDNDQKILVETFTEETELKGLSSPGARPITSNAASPSFKKKLKSEAIVSNQENHPHNLQSPLNQESHGNFQSKVAGIKNPVSP
jgi:hypothetical protein